MIEVCWECKSTSITYEERLGETICDTCGLVLVQNALEETISLPLAEKKTANYLGRTNSSFNLGSMIFISDLNSKKSRTLYNTQRWNQIESPSDKKMIKLCNMALSNYNVQYEIKARVPRYYKILQGKYALRGVSLDIRAAALTYYIVKEIGIATTIKRHAHYTRVTEKEISKNAKVIATILGKPWIFAQVNVEGLVDNVGHNLSCTDSEYLGNVKILAHQVNEILDIHCERLTAAYLAACFYLVSIFQRKRYSQVRLARASGTTEVSLRSNMKKLLIKYGTKKERLYYLTLEEFMDGVR